MLEATISKGYHAVIEEQVLDGARSVDVSLTGGSMKIACEILVTTGRDYELGNLEKYLAANCERVLSVSGDARHVKAMQKPAANQFGESERTMVRFVGSEDALALLAQWAGTAGKTAVRGYKVKTTVAASSVEEAERCRSAAHLDGEFL